MEDLPSEIVTHILSFLPGEELFRCKELNSRFLQMIERTKEKLQLPKIEIYVNDHKPEGIRLTFVKCRNWSEKKFSVSYSNSQIIEIKNDCNGFFSPLFKENCTLPTLQTMFKFLMEKGDIQELSVFSLTDPDCFYSLIEAIENNRNPIRSVFIGPKYDHLPRISDLLTAVASQRRQVDPKLRMRIYIQAQMDYHWERVLRINELACMFSRSWFEFNTCAAGYVMALIAKKWKRCPLKKFNFHLRLRGRDKPLREPSDNVLIRDVDDFIVTKTKGPYLLCISPIEVEASVRFEDVHNGNILEFHKRQGEYKPFCEGKEDVIIFEITASLK